MVFQSYLQRKDLTANKMRRSLPAWSWNDYLRVVCIIFATLSAMLAAAVVGTAIHSFHTFRVQRDANNPWWLPLWPQHFDITGTKTLIGAGCGIILINTIYIILSVLPKLNQSGRSVLATLAAIVLSTASSLLSILSIVLILILNRRAPRTDTIQTWTCKFNNNIPSTMMAMGGGGADLSNDLFGTLCAESKFGFYGMISILVLGALLFISTFARCFTGRPEENRYPRPARGAKVSDDGYSF